MLRLLGPGCQAPVVRLMGLSHVLSALFSLLFYRLFFLLGSSPQQFPTLLLLPEVSFCGNTLLLFPPCFPTRVSTFLVFAQWCFPCGFKFCFFLLLVVALWVFPPCGFLLWLSPLGSTPFVFARGFLLWIPTMFLGLSPFGLFSLRFPPLFFTCDVFFPPVVCLLVVYPSVCFLPCVFSLSRLSSCSFFPGFFPLGVSPLGFPPLVSPLFVFFPPLFGFSPFLTFSPFGFSSFMFFPPLPLWDFPRSTL